jgi:predicted anti-sigma-YlaC factor YlaD
MKCLETEKLIGYAHGLTDEPMASEVREHLADCPRCREIVEKHGRLDALLNEWKAAEPTPGFDAHVRQAVEAQQAGRWAWSFWGRQWARGLALASIGVLLVAGVVWFTQSRFGVLNFSGTARREPSPASGAQTAAPMANFHSPAVMPHAGMRPAQTAPKLGWAGVARNEDKDAEALEDYDLAANFDLLSELPKGERRVAN